MPISLPVVVDADVLWRNIDYAVRLGHEPALLAHADRTATLGRATRVFASDEVREEALRHLPAIADRRGVSTRSLERAWAQLVAPNVRFIKLAAGAIDDPRLAGVHPKDHHVAAVASLLAPSVLITDNRKHFASFQLGDVPSTIVALDLLKMAEFEFGAYGAMLLPRLAGLATVEGSKKVVEKLGPKASVLIALLIAGALVLYFHSEHGRNLRAKVGQTAREIGPPLTELMTEVTDADQRVGAFAIDRAGEPGALALIARDLAMKAAPMRTRDVVEQLQICGYSFDSNRGFAADTRAWLVREPCFTEVQRGWWTLGQHASAPAVDDGFETRIARRRSTLVRRPRRDGYRTST